MTYLVEHSCPQCGGPIEFSETDHLILCAYCNVKSFLAADQYHLVMPSAKDDESFLAPYLRFRGVEYVSDLNNVSYRFVDLTQRGLPLKGLPPTLGIRPQAVKLRFVASEKARRLKNYLSQEEAIKRAESASNEIRKHNIRYRVYIGETISRIYLPLSINDGKLYDAVTNQTIGKLPEDKDIFEPAYDDSPLWRPDFIATVCPKCGWNLDGEADSIALHCANCETIWQIRHGKFEQLPFEVLGGEGDIFLPFWKIRPQFTGIELDTYADFLKLTNQPVVIKKEWHNQPLFIWTPAFKVRPKIYLRLAKQLTVSQRNFEPQSNLPDKLFPLTMPAGEAVESLKIILAESACYKKNVLPVLPEISCAAETVSLVYLPFRANHDDLIQEIFRININQRILEYGRYL